MQNEIKKQQTNKQANKQTKNTHFFSLSYPKRSCLESEDEGVGGGGRLVIGVDLDGSCIAMT
jgi:hypothetical protein